MSDEVREPSGEFAQQECDWYEYDAEHDSDGVVAQFDWVRWCYAEYHIWLEDSEEGKDLLGAQFVEKKSHAARKLDAYLFRTQAACKKYRKEHPDAAYVEWNVPW